MIEKWKNEKNDKAKRITSVIYYVYYHIKRLTKHWFTIHGGYPSFTQKVTEKNLSNVLTFLDRDHPCKQPLGLQMYLTCHQIQLDQTWCCPIDIRMQSMCWVSSVPCLLELSIVERAHWTGKSVRKKTEIYFFWIITETELKPLWEKN